MDKRIGMRVTEREKWEKVLERGRLEGEHMY